MAHKRHAPTDPREWLNRASSNLALARSNIEGALLEDLCFEAQQAAEKSIKAVFVHRRVSFPYIHDLDQLLDRLEASGLKIPKYVREADELSPFAVTMCYPGLFEPVTRARHARAVRIAESVFRWAERITSRVDKR